MSLDSVLPMLFRCPECDTQLKEVVYGMLAGPPAANEVAGGCEWSDEAPTKVCPNCQWEGGLGGRTWGTRGSRYESVPDPAEPYGSRMESIPFDLINSTIDELLELGMRVLQARFELVHRGVDAEAIDSYFEQFDESEAHSWPLIRKQAVFIFFNSETELIEQACIYGAQRSLHEFMYLRPGMDDWEIVDSMIEFRQLVFGMKRDGVEVWHLDIDEGNLFSPEADFSPSTYGSDSIQAMLTQKRVNADELYKEGGRYERPIYWPHWFDPGVMINCVLNPWVQR